MRCPSTNTSPVTSTRASGLWSTLLGDKGDPHFGVLHIASYLFLAFGFILLSNAWRVLYHAQRSKTLAALSNEV